VEAAVTEGSPAGARNHVRVSVLVDRESVTVDIADQGPATSAHQQGERVPSLTYGSGDERGVDELGYFADSDGMVVRLRVRLRPRE
jgi:hypothetical protein